MIEVNNITKKFGDFTAIQDISFAVQESSIYGLVGYNGAGKTTLLKIAAGIIKPTQGQVLMGGIDTFDSGDIRTNMIYIPDDVYFMPTASLNRMKKLYKGYFPNFSDKVYDNMVEAMGLDPKKSIASFSKGMKRQAEIVLAMSTMPKYMLLDEVFDGIDPQKRNMCKKIFIEYMAETGCSMIMSSHNLQELTDLCDHIGLINGKRLTMDVSVDDISSKYKKYRLIFDSPEQIAQLQNIPNKGIQSDGKMATIIVTSDIDDSIIYSLNPIHIDCINLSLEEVFLNEMEDKNYDITKIFS